MPQNKESDTLTQAVKDDGILANETILGQHEKHVQRKQLTTTKLGSLTTYLDVVRNTVNFATINHTVEKLEVNQSIMFQALQQFTALFLRPRVTVWANKFGSQHPQVVFWLARRVETFLVELGKITNNFTVLSKVKGNRFNDISVAPFKTLLNIFFNTEETILKYVEDDTCLVEVPRTCPDSLNPKKIAAKKAYDDALQTMNRANAAATRSNNHNAGRGDHHGYAGRGDNPGGRGRGTSGRGDGGG